MLVGREWGVFLRFWSDQFPSVFRNFVHGEGEERGAALTAAVSPVLSGVGIIMIVSFLERQILDELRARNSKIKEVKLSNQDWVSVLGVDSTWPGFPLLEALTKLRHCFAHEYGRATNRQSSALASIANQLAANPITLPINKGRAVDIGPFYSIDRATNEIALIETTSGSNTAVSKAVRMTTLSLLLQLHNAHVVDMTSWLNSSK